ncbi:MAG: hypothetical protein B9S33_06075 [Pedosphaera sp. Tous-C6FEB]|nr:MAG: hypothetical protein B9S33_06075 [Pedosphaera sp. Tous-C6FEB]
MPRKTESHRPADWLWIATSDLELVRLAAEREVGFYAAHSKLAEVLEKVLKAELLRAGWTLEKTHDLDRLLEALRERGSTLLPQVEPLCDQLAEVYFTDRYPGFDLDDPDWPSLRTEADQMAALLAAVQARLDDPPVAS